MSEEAMTTTTHDSMAGVLQQGSRPASVLESTEDCSRSFWMLRALGPAWWAIADQVLISGTNFATTVLLVRSVDQEAFGRFALVYLVLLFVNSLQGGLITQPHNILGCGRRGPSYASYTTATVCSQVVFAVFAALLAMLAWAIARWNTLAVTSLLAALPLAIIAWQMQEFARRVLYTEKRVRVAFVIDLISYGGQALLVGGMWWLDILTGPGTLYVLAATTALGAAVGLWMLRGSFTSHIDTSALWQNWHFGKWLAGGEILSNWLATEMFVFLSAAMLGSPVVAGILSAVNKLFGPTRVVAYVFNNVLPIRFSRTLVDEGEEAFHQKFRKACLLAFPLLGGYCLVIGLLAGPLMGLLYGESYSGNAPVLSLYACFNFVAYVALMISTALRAKQRSFEMFMSQLTICLVSIPIGAVMIFAFEIYGAVLGMILSSSGLTVLYWRVYRRTLAEDRETGRQGDREADRGSPEMVLSN